MVAIKSLLASALLSAPLVHGHGRMTKPKAICSHNGDDTKYAATINGMDVLPPGPYNLSPTDNTNNMIKALKASKWKSIRELIKEKAQTGPCGDTTLGTPQDLPDKMEWSHGSGEGFTPSHEGPCEIYCDNTQVFQNDNCAKNFPQAPALLPYNKAGCAGAKVMTFYWMALHTVSWQVYVSCAAINGGAGGAPNTPPGPAPNTPPGQPTIAPSAPGPAPSTPSTPAPGPNPDEDCVEDLPGPPTPGPAPNTPPGSAPTTPSAPAPGPKPDEDCVEDFPQPGEDCEEDLPMPGKVHPY